MIWNVRPTPAAQTSMRLPADDIGVAERHAALRSGLRKPFSKLNSVVLPAPLGPMIPRMVPRADVEAHVLHGLQAAMASTDCAPRRIASVPAARARRVVPIGRDRHGLGRRQPSISPALRSACASASRMRQ